MLRRGFLKITGKITWLMLAGLAIVVYLLKPKNKSGNYAAYFANLKFGTKKLMLFHQPFLSKISESGDSEIDILMGKPMPVSTVNYYYNHLKQNEFDPSKQVQWLIDSNKRMEEYLQLAKTNNLKMLVNAEIDVGLHRGGFTDLEELRKALTIIQSNPDYLTLTGFMGYDPHIVKVPSIVKSRAVLYDEMHETYSSFIEFTKTAFPNLWHDSLTLNGAGSPTIKLHTENKTPANDLAAGSFMVKPTDFDIDTLTDFEPATYIATPILKKLKNCELPGIENYKGILNFWNNKMNNTYFIYGGHWLADLHSPEGIQNNSLFGYSTNQNMINASDETKLGVDDFVFLRPKQSEFVFLQFRDGKIEGQWSPFDA